MTRTILNPITIIALGLSLSTNAFANSPSVMGHYQAQVYLNSIEDALSQTNHCLETAQNACQTGSTWTEAVAWYECGNAFVAWAAVPDTYGYSVPSGYESQEFRLLIQAADAMVNLDQWSNMRCR